MKKNLWVTFLPLWFCVNIVGWLAFNILFYLPFCGVWLMIAVGLILGFLQWVVLQKYIGVDSMWIWASLIPYVLIFFVFYGLTYIIAFNTAIFYLSLFVIFGLLGFLQSRVLAFYVQYPRAWIVVTAPIGVFGMPMAVIAQNLLVHSHSGTHVLIWFIFGSFYAVVTGITLILLETVFSKRQADISTKGGSNENLES